MLSVSMLLSTVIACSSLIPFNPGERESQYLVDQTVFLSQGAIYRRWDLTHDGRADVMTVHVIDPTQLERYKQLQEAGETFDVHFATLPLFYWVDITGKDSWDAIYVDENENGTCRLYAQNTERKRT